MLINDVERQFEKLPTQIFADAQEASISISI